MLKFTNSLNEECGVFGVFRVPNAAKLVYQGLQQLQHRGQDGSGIVTFDGYELQRLRGLGMVSEIFNEKN